MKSFTPSPTVLSCWCWVYYSSLIALPPCLCVWGFGQGGRSLSIFRTWGSLWQAGLIGMVSGLRRRALNSVFTPLSTFPPLHVVVRVHLCVFVHVWKLECGCGFDTSFRGKELRWTCSSSSVMFMSQSGWIVRRECILQIDLLVTFLLKRSIILDLFYSVVPQLQYL